jgi:porin
MKKEQLFQNVPGLALGLVVTILGAAATLAQEDTNTSKSCFRGWLEQDYMLGDWGGLRTKLSDHGVDFEFFYAASLPDNLAGGLRPGGVYQGGLLMTMDLHSEKLAGYEGGTFHVSGLWLNGQQSFSDRYVGDLNKVNLLDFPNAARLWALWYQQKFFGGKLALKLGELSVDRDFIVPEYYNSLGSLTLLNQTFFYPTLAFNLYGIPGLPSNHYGLPATPNAAPGAILRWDPVPQFYGQAGVYNGSPDQSYSGTTFNLSEADGALAYFEAGYRLNPGTNDTGLAGSYKLGGYYHTGEFGDVYDGISSAFLSSAGLPASTVRDHSGNYGVYFLAEQQLYREKEKADPAKQGLVGFFRVEAAPPDRNLTEFGVDGGLVYKGLIPGRDWDTLALAASYLEMSSDIRQAQREANALAPGTFAISDYEAVIELSYKLQMTAWWTVQASLQRVFHPGGSSANPNATVFILQTTLRF